jgi:uncharacterized membrane protein YczE
MTAILGIIHAQNQGQRYRHLETEDIRIIINNVMLFTPMWFTPITAQLMTLPRILLLGVQIQRYNKRIFEPSDCIE